MDVKISGPEGKGCALMNPQSRGEPFLFRFVDNEKALSNSTSGKLWLRPFSHFASHEDLERRDDREGIASGQIEGGNWIEWVNENNMISPQYILSFTECDSAPRNWGEYRLKLVDRCGFIDEIKAAMPGCVVIFGNIKYSDETVYATMPTGIAMWERASLNKRKCYCQEREWRLILLLNGLKIINNLLKIDVGNLIGILDYCPSVRQSP